MSREVQGAFVDGPSRGAKTTIKNSIADGFRAAGLVVVVGDGGEHFRRLGQATFDELDTSWRTVAPDTLRSMVGKMLAAGVAYDDGYPWHNLGSKEAGEKSTLVAQFPEVQADSSRFWDRMAAKARDQEADAVVLAGRNPRRRFARYLNSSEYICRLDMIIDCEPREAARRTLASEGFEFPTTAQLDREEQDIVGRRDRDSKRMANRHVMPIHSVPLTANDPLGDILDQTWTQHQEWYDLDLPHPIYFDTTHVPRDEMIAVAQNLALLSVGLAAAVSCA